MLPYWDGEMDDFFEGESREDRGKSEGVGLETRREKKRGSVGFSSTRFGDRCRRKGHLLGSQSSQGPGETSE